MSDSPSLMSRAGRLVKRYWMLALLLFAGWHIFQSVSPQIELSETGPAAADFALPTLEGDTLRLSDFHGQVVVLNVWASWCPTCRIEVPGLRDLQEDFEEDVQFVGLSVDAGGLDDIRAFARDQALNYPQVASQQIAFQHYGQSTAVPRTYLIDRDSRIRYEHVGMLFKGSLRGALEELLDEEAP